MPSRLNQTMGPVDVGLGSELRPTYTAVPLAIGPTAPMPGLRGLVAFAGSRLPEPTMASVVEIGRYKA